MAPTSQLLQVAIKTSRPHTRHRVCSTESIASFIWTVRATPSELCFGQCLIHAALFIFGDPTLQPLDYTLVVKAGNDGWAYYTKGAALIRPPPSGFGEYTDGRYCPSTAKHSMRFTPF